MRLTCRSCGAPIEEGAIDRPRGLARCAHCGTLTELDMKAPVPQAAPRSRITRAPVPMPARFKLEHPGGKLQISWPWLTWKVMAMLAFCVVWDGFIFVHYQKALTGTGDASMMGLLFPLIHAGAGLVITYITLAGMFNTTTITATRHALDIEHSPLPWPGAGPVDGIAQLYSKEVLHRTKNGRTYTYELHAQLRNGRSRKLIARLDEASQALWLEQTLEAHMQIEDRPVGGEINRFG
ncbi:MAG: hypothetical protein ABIO70_35920 [Pseudomonadota bacterium]